ncbi:hypothetical protein BS50DRAFT_569114 [Corynespora cassiicola Philippines]|uniref:N-acetyltransferase domain-containing protein n=1 Tax=Corynespora cassiicola Philippines TaxID=1448308 RepID=A0A2T2P8A3_CORCC|nr:hypothetical protein BS50DRAFT_569114 [Corynespora cassiicola Philippines]
MTADQPKYVVRGAESSQEAVDLWWPIIQKEGWNRNRNDGPMHYRVGSDGADWLHIVPKELAAGKPQGSVLALKYQNRTGWVAFFIMSEEYRGKGLGRELWKDMELSFKKDSIDIIGLDAVKQQVETYKRRGFVEAGDINLMLRKSLKEQPKEDVDSFSLGSKGLVPLKSVDRAALARLDLKYTGLDRQNYWSDVLLGRDDMFGFAIFGSTDERDSELKGFVVVRECEFGHRFGPLYAEDDSQAYALLHTAMHQIQDSEGSMIAEIYGNNPLGRKLFEKLGWTHAGVDFYRMWLDGKMPDAQSEGRAGTQGMYAIFDACAG